MSKVIMIVLVNNTVDYFAFLRYWVLVEICQENILDDGVYMLLDILCLRFVLEKSVV